MAAPTKVNNIIALLGKPESVYGGGGTLDPAVDTLPLYTENPQDGISMERVPLYDGDLGADPMSLAPTARTAPTGWKATFAPKCRFGGRGTTVYAANVVPTIHRYLLTCGWQATLISTPGSEEWRYVPEIDPWSTWNRDTMAFELLRAGEMWAVRAAMGSLKINGTGPKPLDFEFAYVGQSLEPVDQSTFPAVSLPNFVYPNGSQTTVQIGDFAAAKLLSFSFDDRHDISTDRAAMNAEGGYDGPVPGRRQPMAKVVIEAGTFAASPFHTASALNPYRLNALATRVPFVLQNGTQKGARILIEMDNVQIGVPKPGTNGSQPTWEFDVYASASAPGLNDYIRIRCT